MSEGKEMLLYQSTGISIVKPTEKVTTELTTEKRWWLHLKLLLWKNFLLYKRNYRTTVFQILTPIIICIFLVVLQAIADDVLEYSDVNTHIYSMQTFPKCRGDGCITLGVGTTGPQNNFTSYILNNIADRYDLKMHKDIRVISENDPYKFIDYLDKHENKTQVGLMFCTGPVTFTYNDTDYTVECSDNYDNPSIMTYSIVTNSTLIPTMFLGRPNEPASIDFSAIMVKMAVDQAILDYVSERYGREVADIELDMQSYPIVRSRYWDGYDVVVASGGFYFFIPPMVTFVVIMIELAREKEQNLRQGLNVMGMSSMAYWMSWFITAHVFIFLVTTTLIVTGLVCDFDVFTNTPYFILAMLFGIFSHSMVMLAFFLSTIVKSSRAAYTLSYAFILVGLVLQFFFADQKLLEYFYSEAVPDWVIIIRLLFTFYPPFSFAKTFGEVARKSGHYFSSSESAWVEGPGYEWSDLTKTYEGEIADSHYELESTLYTFMILMLDSLVFAISTWFCDHVISGNRGNGEPVYFMFTPKFYGCKKRERQASLDTPQPINDDNVTDPVRMERLRIIEDEINNIPCEGMRIVNISKTYRKYPFNIRSKKDIYAVKNVYLEIRNNELLALLGHNGAGKSTLIGVLTGLLYSDSGTANVNSLDLKEDLLKIRRNLGYCPQFDLLWGELTAREHLHLFARLKGMHPDKVKHEVQERLEDVNLLDVGDNRVDTFSGGMKRRLSVAISGIGNPGVIILDEPTTGMDPISRRQVWEYIQKMKTGRVIILTTHSMEEAEVLSDKVAVIVDGNIRCLGTSLYLKNKFGEGYRISVTTKDPQTTSYKLQEIIPKARFLDESASSLVYSVPLECVKEIGIFVEEMEENMKDWPEVDDWSLSHTTLEEVFMRVTCKKESKREEIHAIN